MGRDRSGEKGVSKIKMFLKDLRAEIVGGYTLWSNEEKKDVGPMVHDPDLWPIRERENLSAPPKLESRPTVHLS